MTAMTNTLLPPHRFALAVAIAPVLAVHICYLLSVSAGNVPLCNPYWDGCASISASGRQPPAVFLFKAVMLPQALALATYWYLTAAWLRFRGVPQTTRAPILVIGIVGALFLALYVTYLGHSGDFYRLMRRYGITIFFAFTVLAALLNTRVLWQRRHVWPEQRSLIKAQLILCALLLGLGLASIPARNWLGKDRAENALEWVFALLMQGLFLLSALLWRRSGFTLQIGRG